VASALPRQALRTESLTPVHDLEKATCSLVDTQSVVKDFHNVVIREVGTYPNLLRYYKLGLGLRPSRFVECFPLVFVEVRVVHIRTVRRRVGYP